MTHLTPAQAAAILRLSPVRVRQFCQEGRIGKLYGRSWLITEAELAAFKRQKRQPGRPKQ
jgi:hypothetical protein